MAVGWILGIPTDPCFQFLDVLDQFSDDFLEARNQVLTEAGVFSQSSCGRLRPWTAPGADGVEGLPRQLVDSQLSTLL
ncbi:hypothetical protein [Desulfosoma sp.]